MHWSSLARILLFCAIEDDLETVVTVFVSCVARRVGLFVVDDQRLWEVGTWRPGD